MKIERYSAYKQTGIPWLPEVPEGWTIQRLRNLFSQRHELYTADEQLIVLSLLKDIGIIPYDEKGAIGNKSKNDMSEYKVARKGDIVMNSMNVIIGSVDITPYDGYISPAYYALTAREGVECRYFNYIFHLKRLQQAMRSLAKGILEIRLRISSTNLFGMYYPVPSLFEQQSIVSFLDDKCGKIDVLVAAKEKEVELLKELKQTVIADAVTRGIDGEIPSVETGVFWQQLMPHGWSVRKLRHVLKKLNRRRPVDAELLVCTNKGTVNKRGDAKIGLISEDVTIYQGVEPEDLLIHGMDTWHGAIAVSGLRGMCTSVVHVCDSNQNKSFVAHYLRNMARGKLFKLLSNGVRQNTSDFRSWEKLAPLLIVLPPREEQDRIVSFIEEKTAKIDQAVAGLTEQIAALKEYKQRLIADVVTGQMKVVA